ncbi:RNA polymerase subunit sigma-70 [Streptomyces puniciscabiei]
METDIDKLISAAALGDERAYAALVAPHRSAIHLHCYRMLGSFHDAEEATQEALTRAWSSMSTYERRAPFQHWLYRIATTTCLMMIRAASRRPQRPEEVTHLSPYPDRLLDTLPDSSLDPAREVQQRESVTLAFITALQLLPATQRAALILKDVLAFSSAETATVLGTTTASVNSALQRARSRLKEASHDRRPATLDDTDRDVLDRFMAAWQRRDIDGITALLAKDATLRMPPQPMTFRGPEEIGEFFATVPVGGRLDLIPLTTTRANASPALAAYAPASATDSASPRAYGVMVFQNHRSRIAQIIGFADPALFPWFGLPLVLDSSFTGYESWWRGGSATRGRVLDGGVTGTAEP